MKNQRPIIGITMGDPVGIGPEIILKALCKSSIYEICKPLVFGDAQILDKAKKCVQSSLDINIVRCANDGIYKFGCVDVLNLSALNPDKTIWGHPTIQTGKAMERYIIEAVDAALEKNIAAVVTCPINKMALNAAGFKYNGHTELLAERTNADEFAMMLAGDKLRVILVTIHIPLKNVSDNLSKENIFQTIKIASDSLTERFGIENPRVAVAGLNPHAGEEGMFGDEEINIIAPAVLNAKENGFNVFGPCPPDTVFYQATKGKYDAVVCMYHDQGLIPFKLTHFTNGVNTTLGLPIIRTSVDHGTAYDIAGTGCADSGSLVEAINMAVKQANFQTNF